MLWLVNFLQIVLCIILLHMQNLWLCFWCSNLFVEQVVSPFPPSDKLGITSVQRESEEIVPMKQMKMDWVPYIPLENRYFEPSISTCQVSCKYFLTCFLLYYTVGSLKLKDSNPRFLFWGVHREGSALFFTSLFMLWIVLFCFQTYFPLSLWAFLVTYWVEKMPLWYPRVSSLCIHT